MDKLVPVIIAGFTAALSAFGLEAAAADKGLDWNRDCNYEAAPRKGCVEVTRTEDDKLRIQPLRFGRISWSKIKVYRNGNLDRVVVKHNATGCYIPYRNGRYLVKSKTTTKRFPHHATATKRFTVTDAW